MPVPNCCKYHREVTPPTAPDAKQTYGMFTVNLDRAHEIDASRVDRIGDCQDLLTILVADATQGRHRALSSRRLGQCKCGTSTPPGLTQDDTRPDTTDIA